MTNFILISDNLMINISHLAFVDLNYDNRDAVALWYLGKENPSIHSRPAPRDALRRWAREMIHTGDCIDYREKGQE
jgi:hypothetical protein